MQFNSKNYQIFITNSMEKLGSRAQSHDIHFSPFNLTYGPQNQKLYVACHIVHPPASWATN